MIGIGSLLGLVGGISKDVISFVIESKKQTKELEINRQSEERQKELELQILEKQIELHKAGVDIETQKRIAIESQSNAEIVKSNNSVESSVLDIRKAEINTPQLEYLLNADGSIKMNSFFSGGCNILICITNCFKAAPLLSIICLIGFLIFILSIKEGVVNFSNNDFCMGLLTLLEVMTSYFTGRKISTSFTEGLKKKA